MKNNKGQALVEFIIIVPVLILIISALLDFGNIIYQKYKLEDNLDTVINLYELNKNNDIDNYLMDNNISINYEYDGEYTKIILKKDVNINTIILNNIIGKKYQISTDKTIVKGDANG